MLPSYDDALRRVRIKIVWRGVAKTTSLQRIQKHNFLGINKIIEVVHDLIIAVSL